MSPAIGQERSERWAELRALGQATATQAIQQATFEHGIHDALDQLAFQVGMSRASDPVSGLAPPFNYRWHAAKTSAIEDGRSWPEITEAMGDTDTASDRARDLSIRNTRRRYFANQERLEVMRGQTL